MQTSPCCRAPETPVSLEHTSIPYMKYFSQAPSRNRWQVVIVLRSCAVQTWTIWLPWNWDAANECTISTLICRNNSFLCCRLSKNVFIDRSEWRCHWYWRNPRQGTIALMFVYIDLSATISYDRWSILAEISSILQTMGVYLVNTTDKMARSRDRRPTNTVLRPKDFRASGSVLTGCWQKMKWWWLVLICNILSIDL